MFVSKWKNTHCYSYTLTTPWAIQSGGIGGDDDPACLNVLLLMSNVQKDFLGMLEF